MSFLVKNKIAIFVAIVGISFITIGVFRSEHETVIRKAINICLECIGLG